MHSHVAMSSSPKSDHWLSPSQRDAVSASLSFAPALISMWVCVCVCVHKSQSQPYPYATDAYTVVQRRKTHFQSNMTPQQMIFFLSLKLTLSLLIVCFCIDV